MNPEMNSNPWCFACAGCFVLPPGIDVNFVVAALVMLYG